MEKINFCSAMQPKSLKEFPEERCEFCADYYCAADVDALLADVRGLVEATMEWHSVDDCHAEGRSDCRLCKAIAAVERHFSNKN